ncbi:phage repressor protein CI, partial [Salmonella enterica subsp. enterica]|nr:phage repressor protein CI [Salmonella enterica subsp. enterica]
GGISIRELTKLPGRKLHVTGGKVPFECGIDDIKTLGRVVGVYSEVN